MVFNSTPILTCAECALPMITAPQFVQGSHGVTVAEIVNFRDGIFRLIGHSRLILPIHDFFSGDGSKVPDKCHLGNPFLNVPPLSLETNANGSHTLFAGSIKSTGPSGVLGRSAHSAACWAHYRSCPAARTRHTIPG